MRRLLRKFRTTRPSSENGAAVAEYALLLCLLMMCALAISSFTAQLGARLSLTLVLEQEGGGTSATNPEGQEGRTVVPVPDLDISTPGLPDSRRAR